VRFAALDILAGVVVGAVFSSILLFLITLSQRQAAHDSIGVIKSWP